MRRVNSYDIFKATSNAVEPSSEKKTFLSEPFADFTNRSANNAAGSLANPSAEVCATFFNCRRKAAFNFG